MLWSYPLSHLRKRMKNSIHNLNSIKRNSQITSLKIMSVIYNKLKFKLLLRYTKIMNMIYFVTINITEYLLN